ncbi:hypothetical protein [Yoonia sp.]|uniref:hypothetical protein n=1 Tax=Yoonia sp. TaxID=2212373 RepID=UPI002E085613|nr:hypothetical protein [Yoonia sp.]
MRILDPTSAEYLSARTGVASRHMVHVIARNPTTGAAEALGLWQGDDHLTIAINGTNRTYYGAGGLIGVEPIRADIGLEVRMLQVALSPLTPEVAQLLRGYDARLAPAEVHRGLLSLETGQLITAPIRVFRGWVDEVKIRTGEVGGTGEATVTLASAARGLTRAPTLTRSDAEMRRRNAGVRFRDYADVAGEVGVWWGEKRERA